MTYYSYYGMINTNMAKKIVTNLRIDETDWLRIKAMAAEAGLSVNEYINSLIKTISTKIELALDQKELKEEKSIWDLPKLAKIKDKPMGASEDDKIIYGL